MEPLCVRAQIGGPLCMPENPIALDALLGYAVCVRDGIAPAMSGADLAPLQIPIAQSNCGRVYLASFAQYVAEAYELRHITKRAPIEQYQAHGGEAIKRVQITAGPNKSYRIPLETVHVTDDVLTWFTIGDAEEIELLLALIHYLGKKRSAGLGKVERWLVTAHTDPWPGFPVALNGKPLRTLPTDWHGLIDADIGMACLQPPYWLRERETLCAVPSRVA